VRYSFWAAREKLFSRATVWKTCKDARSIKAAPPDTLLMYKRDLLPMQQL
jgi:hypothetical protein